MTFEHIQTDVYKVTLWRGICMLHLYDPRECAWPVVAVNSQRPNLNGLSSYKEINVALEQHFRFR